MPTIEPLSTPSAHLQLVQSYRAGGFTIAGVRHEGSVLVLPGVTRPWPPGAPEEIALDTLGPVLEAEPAVEILVVGAGARFALVGAELRAALKARGIVVESMDTRAACRTFNVLLAEERRVAAALIAL
jgi:uncharacterized protein